MSTQPENELEQMQGAAERTTTVPVMERKVVVENGVKTEVGVPKQVFVRPMPARRWVKAMAYLTNIISALPNTGIDLDDPMQMVIWVTHLLGKVPDDLFAIIELATDEDAEFFDRIDLDECINVVMAVVQVNKDFFVQKVLPTFSAIAPALKQKLESVTSGQTP